MSVVIAATGFVVALRPRLYNGELAGGKEAFGLRMWPRLVRFPIFWIGLALLAYVLTQGLNPGWRYIKLFSRWWVVSRRNISWLPTSIEGPFAESNAWRQLIVYSSAWLSVCGIWVGLTRRRSLRILLGVVVGNALLLGGLLGLQRFTDDHRIPWPLTAWTPNELTASFIYENHTGAYLALAVFCAIALATWHLDHGSRSLAKSTPAGVLALGALFLAGAVIFTLSRGAVLSMSVTLAIFGVWFFLRRKFLPEAPGANPALSNAMFAVFALFIVVAVHYLNFSEIYGRWDTMITQKAQETSVHARLLARAAAVDMLKEQGIRGVGAGGFRYLFPRYVSRYPEIFDHGNLYWQHAHCDWLEIPIELGVAGDLLIVAGAGWGLIWFGRRRTLWNALVVPLLLGCLQTLIHAGFDFPFQCPAILTTWCVLVAVGGKWIELEGE